MPELVADDLARNAVEDPLPWRQQVSRRSAGRRAFPSGQLLVTRLRVQMPQPVHVAEAGGLAFAVVDVALLDIGPMRRNQRSGAGELVGLIKGSSLLRRGDRYRSLLAALWSRSS